MLEIIIIIILGIIFGSFGSVLIGRLDGDFSKKTIKSILFGRSYCPHCKHTLKAQNLIPILSFLFQRGKCSYCKKKISIIYPTLEILSGTIFLLTFLLIPRNTTLELVFRLILNRGLLLLIIYDIQKYELNTSIRLFLLIRSISLQLIINPGNRKIILIGALAFAIIFLLIYLFAKRYVKIRGFSELSEGFGFGDVMMALLFGALSPSIFSISKLSFNISNLFYLIFLFLFISSAIGIIYYIIETLISKNKKKIIPFLPSMILAFWILLFMFDKLLKFIS